MKKLIIVLIALVALLGLGVGGYVWYDAVEADFQANADAKRIHDVHRIAALVEAYRDVRGYYPFADRVASLSPDGPVPVAVNITNLTLDPVYGSPPPGNDGVILPFEEFAAELRSALGDDIEIPFDPQKAGVYAPNFYQYFTNGVVYFVSANLYSPTGFTREIGPHYFKYQVSSAVATGYAIRRFGDISEAELEAARQAGEAAELRFWYLGESG